MMILSPSVLAADFTKLGEEIKKIEAAGVPYIHIDVMDGLFVPSISFGMPVLTSIRKATKLFLDVHLMIVDPERYLEEFADCGADGITVHAESTKDITACLLKIRELGKRVGITIKPGTPVSEIEAYLTMVDMVLIMTVEPGFGGQKYIESSTPKIKELREIIKQKKLSVDIEVDGGINKDNLSKVVEAGANIIVAGSAVFGENSEYTMRYFTEQLNYYHEETCENKFSHSLICMSPKAADGSKEEQ